MQFSRRQLAAVTIATLVMIAIGVLASVVGSRIRAKAEHRLAIFTIHKIVPGTLGTILLSCDKELFGDNVRCGIATKTATSVIVYFERSHGRNALWETLGSDRESKWEGSGSYELGDCPLSQIVKAPQRVELKPGEHFVVATCRDTTGATVELYFFCE
jgi:hypothetical protein